MCFIWEMGPGWGNGKNNPKELDHDGGNRNIAQ